MELADNLAKLLFVQEFNQENQIENNAPAPAEKIEPTPNNPPWSSPAALGFWLVSILFIFVLPSLLLLPYLFGKGVQLSDNSQLMETILNDPAAIAISLGGTFLAHILTLALGWVLVTNYRKYSFREMLGWNWGGFRIWHGALILIGIYAAAVALTNLLGTQENEMSKILESSRLAVYLVAFVATVSAPIVEEVVYRGVLYSAFQRTFNVPAAVIFVTFIFAAVHFRQYYPDYATLISICLLSLVITLIRAKTDNLWPCIVFHTVFNGLQSLLLILSPYLPLPEGIEPLPEKASSIIHLISLHL